jgi:predicted glycosyltransferase
MEQQADTFLFYLGHPAHYHNVSVVIQQLSKKGYRVVLVARGKDVLFDLLDELPYEIIYLKPKKGVGKLSLIATVVKREFVLYRLALKYKPKILIGTDIVIAHVGNLLGIPSIILNEDDAKEVPFLAKFGFRYATKVLSPNCCDITPYNFRKVGYNGYHELAYLHPNYFTPDKTKVKELLTNGDKYFILRFAELTAHHDEGKKGISSIMAKKIIEKLSPFGQVYVTSEKKLKPELEKYRITINPKNIHHAIYFAQMYIGDSQTMAAEAAVLGTPSLRFNDFVGKLGYLEELEHKHKLTFGFPTDKSDALFSKIDELLENEELSEVFKDRRANMLSQCDDVAQFWISYFIENRKK